MPMNRVQFQPGLSMPEFFKRYATEGQCKASLQATRWPNGFVCPGCGGAARTSFVRGGLRYWQCGACAHQCSLISGTIFEASKLPLTRWFLAMQLLTQSKNNVSALELMRQLGVSYRTAWLVKHKIMEAMRMREEPRELALGSGVRLQRDGGEACAFGELGLELGDSLAGLSELRLEQLRLSREDAHPPTYRRRPRRA